MLIAARAVAADRADAPTEQQCSNRYAPGAHNDEQSARATYEHCLEDAKSIAAKPKLSAIENACALKHLQDGEVAETEEQRDNYDRPTMLISQIK